MRVGIVASLTVIAVALLSAAAIAAQPATAGAKPAAAPKAAAAPARPNPNLAPIPAEIAPTAPVGVMTEETIKKMGNVTQAQRDEMVKKLAAKLKAMTPKERQAFFEDNRRHYQALTPAQKQDLKDKLKKSSAEYIAAHKGEWEKSVAEQNALRDKYTKEFLEKMPGIERAVLQKYKDMRKTHSKDYAWRMIIDDAGKGGKLKPLPE